MSMSQINGRDSHQHAEFPNCATPALESAKTIALLRSVVPSVYNEQTEQHPERQKGWFIDVVARVHACRDQLVAREKQLP